MKQGGGSEENSLILSPEKVARVRDVIAER
jgi:hypothetical protein